MATRLNLGFTRKIGEPNYGSRGASISLDVELDRHEAADPEMLHQRINELFRQLEEAVDAELERTQHPKTHEGNGKTTALSPTAKPKKATQLQLRALEKHAEEARCDLVALVREEYGVDSAADLTIAQASDLIDRWRRRSRA